MDVCGFLSSNFTILAPLHCLPFPQNHHPNSILCNQGCGPRRMGFLAMKGTHKERKEKKEVLLEEETMGGCDVITCR